MDEDTSLQAIFDQNLSPEELRTYLERRLLRALGKALQLSMDIEDQFREYIVVCGKQGGKKLLNDLEKFIQ